MGKLISALLIALMLLLGAGCVSAPAIAPESEQASAPVVSGPKFGFDDEEELREHYSKHRWEFGQITQDEYLTRARELRDAEVGGHILQIIRGDNVRTRYDQKRGDFIAFTQDLTIITFFRPNNGERYFYRQATRPR